MSSTNVTRTFARSTWPISFSVPSWELFEKCIQVIVSMFFHFFSPRSTLSWKKTNKPTTCYPVIFRFHQRLQSIPFAGTALSSSCPVRQTFLNCGSGSSAQRLPSPRRPFACPWRFIHHLQAQLALLLADMRCPRTDRDTTSPSQRIPRWVST